MDYATQSRYLSGPALSFMTKTELELFYWTYYGMDLFFEKGIRGGAWYIFKRYSQASNKSLKSSDWKQESNKLLSWMQMIYVVM